MTPDGEENEMGQPVVHFEVVGKDGDKLQSYYAELFGWNINSDNEMNYGMVDGKDNKTADGGIGIGGGVGQGPEGYGGHVTFYVAVPDVEERCRRPRASAGSA
jgi:predicted enzyme related to lactoylglutathione lyase